MARGVDQIDPVTVPGAAHRSGKDGDPTIAFLGVEVGDGGAVMDLAPGRCPECAGARQYRREKQFQQFGVDFRSPHVDVGAGRQTPQGRQSVTATWQRVTTDPQQANSCSFTVNLEAQH